MYYMQLAFLRTLNAARGPHPIAVAQHFYDGGKASAPEVYADQSLTSWVGFLQSWNLVNRVNDTVEITDIGQEFLVWMAITGRREPIIG